MKKKLFLLIAATLCLYTAASAQSDTTAWGTILRRETPRQRESLRILVIGNSFTVDAVNQNLCELLDEAGIDATIGNLYIGGCTLQRHWKTIADTSERQKHVYYEITSGGVSKTKGACIEDALRKGPWDWVVFQQGGGQNGFYNTHFPWMDYLKGYIQAFLPAGSYKTAFQQSWAYHRSSTRTHFEQYGYDQDRMFAMLVEAGEKLTANVDVVIPTCTAIQNGRYTHLGDNFHRDNTSHLELSYGRYTAACTLFEALTGIDVRGFAFHPGSLSADLARLCQECAHEAVANPYTVTIVEK